MIDALLRTITVTARISARAALVLIIAPMSAILAQQRDSALAPAPRLIGIFDPRTGAPLAGVQVRDAFSGSYVLTTSTGTARLDFLTFRGDASIVELRKLGYQAKQIVLNRGDRLPITEVLEPFVELAPIVTTERYRIDQDAGRWAGFEERCQSKSVTCIRSEELEKHPAGNLADLLIRANGVTIGSCAGASGPGSGSKGNQRNTQCGNIAMHSLVVPPAYCQPTFFVDGIEWNSHLGQPTDLVPDTPPVAPYTPTNVKAVEVYPPERARPLRFEGDPTCGAVVIWTK